MDITEVSIVHHIGIVLMVLWFLASIGWSHTVLYFGALLYLFAVNQQYTVRLRRKLQYEERKYANQRRLLSDSESVRWLNHAVEKIWPICLEQIASQQFLLPIIPWFLDKYKPWTASKAVVENLYLGRNPPMFTEIRVLGQSSDDDHLVLELGMSFLSAKDMNAVLAVQLRKTLGLGMWTNMHVAGMHVEGKVLVGVKFLRQWPFIERMRVCFAEVPYFQMTVKPIFTHGIDVTELPGIAGWLDNLLAVAFEQTLVQPNMLVIDVEKFVSTPSESWFSVYEKPPIAYVKLEIIEAADMKPSDLNGLADPYVKAHLGNFRIRTKIHKKTLYPKWFEEFKIPISSWEVPNILSLEVRDKDHIFDDLLGECSVNISDLRGGQRHDKWLTLKNIKKGRLHLAITVYEDETELSKLNEPTTPKPNSNVQNNETDPSLEEHQQMADEFEPINIEGQEKTGLWVHRPGKDVCQTWEPRKGRSRRVAETELQAEGSEGIESLISETSGSDENVDVKKISRHGTIGRGLQKLGSYFQRTPKMQNSREAKEEVSPIPSPNIRSVEVQGTAVRIILDESIITESGDLKVDGQQGNHGKIEVDSPGKNDASKKPYANIKGVMKRKVSTKSISDEALERQESSRMLMEHEEVDS
ncbi:C2 domain-containing protein At1g53590 [Dendrobium catenatum]|uniref:C2 domain-containing protein n=1 Tax=Dendrobium catenatum TaxID=906689 RepID=A0A2I0WV31_9ASPA|nr:C2 domain-containing protein At1g53590 [Dendrobium catenatum]PKU79519.1 C2 domain-containing protein [Dendrobium catenatum]